MVGDCRCGLAILDSALVMPAALINNVHVRYIILNMCVLEQFNLIRFNLQIMILLYKIDLLLI